MKDLFHFEKPVFRPQSLQSIRIPYQGSKQKIMPQLLDKMLEVKPKAKYFYDLFGGGASASFTALQYGFKVHYNELYKPMANFVEYIINRVWNNERSSFGIFPEEWYNFVTRERFFEATKKDDPFSQFCRIVYSFGNNQRCYMYGKHIEKQKHLAHDFVVFQCEKSLKEFNDMFDVNFTISNAKTWNERRLHYKTEWNKHLKANVLFQEMISSGHIKNVPELTTLSKKKWLENAKNDRGIQNLGRIENLERIQNLERIENLTFSNLSYEDVPITTPLEETIIYIDPPYKGTAGYKVGKNFDYDALYTFFKESPYTVFLSEYDAPFESILEIQKMKLFNNTLEKRSYATEKLFWNGK